MVFIKSISDISRKDLPTAGGKGANLGELLKAGFNVPYGFVITTDGYQEFLTANHLGNDATQIFNTIQADDFDAYEKASTQIRDGFCNGIFPPDLSNEITNAYHNLSKHHESVAVRSSATVEDLPDFSFAGQQDTYLNICDEKSLMQAILKCWASLWTARAISYRSKNIISNENIALAVVVQRMIQSEVSGVLFTANPLTGKRTETVIEATFGLGEALVSGQVEPDHYEIDNTNKRILKMILGSKALMIQGQDGGGTVKSDLDNASRQALADEYIHSLTNLGLKAVSYFGIQQDMEWALSQNELYILQSRPITTLYPLPVHANPEKLEVFFSFGVWQGMLDPYTPLGQDILTYLVSGIAKIFAIDISPAEQEVMQEAGQRMYLNITDLLHSSIGRRILAFITPVIDPVSGKFIDDLLLDSRLTVKDSINVVNILRLMRGVFPFVKNIVFYLFFPRRGRERLQSLISRSSNLLKEKCDHARDLSELVISMQDSLINMVKNLMPPLVAAVASGYGISLQFLTRMSAEIPHGQELVMELSRGLSYNVTMDMDLALWKIAHTIRSDPRIFEYFKSISTASLVANYQANNLPPSAQSAIENFLEQYGMRGIGEIDFGRPRWKEDPSHVFQMIKGYLQIEESSAPDVIFQNSIEKGRQAEENLIAAISNQPGGIIKAHLARAVMFRFRELGGLREFPKFVIVQRMAIFRNALLVYGKELTEKHILNQEQDLFYLHLHELFAFAKMENRNWQDLIVERRAAYQREVRRKRIPRLLLSDGTAFYDVIPQDELDDDRIIKGSPVSPGIVYGTVHVITDPSGVQMNPGEILVCPATDPAWTPLFLLAAGLVMEVGGMMTHGSVVAREFGIPAVVGVQKATQRLNSGQHIRQDGSNGMITILESLPETN